MAQIERHAVVPRWKGTVSDIADVARVVRELAPPPETPNGERSVWDLTIKVEYDQGHDEFQSPDELVATLRSEDLRRTRSIKISSGRYRDDLSAAVNFNANTGSGAFIAVEGADRTQVEGVRTRLAARLREGRRGGSAVMQDRFGYALFGIVAGVSLGYVLILLSRAQADEPDDLNVPVLVWTAAASIAYALGGAWALATRLVPRLELLELGQRTRWQRWRGAVIAGFVLPILGAGYGVIAGKLF